MSEDLTRVERWDARLKAVFDEIDRELETEAALKKSPYRLHPVRLPAGATSNPEDDGLFDIGASFTAGIGSEYGPGYALTFRMATLEHVPAADIERLQNRVVAMLRERLPKAFPGTDLRVVEDVNGWKIVGDLSLGALSP